MSNSVDGALEWLRHIEQMLHYGDVSTGLFIRPDDAEAVSEVRSTLTAQQQRIEALEAVLQHAVSVHGGSRGSQYKWLEHAQELLSDEALNKPNTEALYELARIAQETGQYD